MADSLNRIAPATVPLGKANQGAGQRQEKNQAKAGKDKQPRPPMAVNQSAPPADESSEAESPKGRHVNINA